MSPYPKSICHCHKVRGTVTRTPDFASCPRKQVLVLVHQKIVNSGSQKFLGVLKYLAKIGKRWKLSFFHLQTLLFQAQLELYLFSAFIWGAENPLIRIGPKRARTVLLDLLSDQSLSAVAAISCSCLVGFWLSWSKEQQPIHFYLIICVVKYTSVFIKNTWLYSTHWEASEVKYGKIILTCYLL